MNKNSIKSTLNNYLKQKNYPINERFRKSDLVLTQSKEDFLMDLKINSEISRTNSFIFSNISSLNGSQSLVDQQISRLIKFVQCQRNFTVRKELENLLPPIICHLYIEMLKGKEWRPAHDFLRKYSCLVGTVQELSQQRVNGSDPTLLAPHPIHFLPHQQTSNFHHNIYNRFMPSTSKYQPPQLSQLNIDEQKLTMFKELISNLSCLRRLEDVKDNKLIFSFRSCKYKARLANKTLSVLNKYLSKHGHVLLIQILHLWFNMDLYDLHDDDSSSSSSSSSSEYNNTAATTTAAIMLNNFDHNDMMMHRNQTKSSSSSNVVVDRYTDPSYCDTLENDIKFNANSGLQFDKSTTTANRCDDNLDFFASGGSSNSSNLKMKRLRECLHRVDSKYHKPIRIFNINYTDNSLCTASTDKQLCHLAAGFEDSTIVLWSINGFENYGHKPFQTFDDRLCQWSINNCNRMLTDDLSDYDTSDEEIEKNLREASCVSNDGDDEIDVNDCNAGNLAKLSRRKKCGNKYRRTISIREQWKEFTENNSSENNFSLDSQSIILRGHRSSVTDVIFGRNDTLLSVSRDKTFRLWKADSYTCASVYRGHEFPIWCVDESSNGCYAATGSRDTTARLWSYERKFPVRVYAGHTQDVDCIAFHPNGNYFATGSADTTIRMWCVTSGRLLRIFTESHLPVNTISFSPDGKLLAAAGDESKVRIFDLAAGQQLLDLKNHTASVKSLCWSSNSKKLLSGCTDGSFFVWNINTLGLSSSSTNLKDSKSSSSMAVPSSSKHHATSSSEFSSKTSSSNTASTSSSSSSSLSSLLQSNSTGCKRIVKVFFSGPDELVHAIGND